MKMFIKIEVECEASDVPKLLTINDKIQKEIKCSFQRFSIGTEKPRKGKLKK